MTAANAIRAAFLALAAFIGLAFVVLVVRYVNAIPILWMTDYVLLPDAGERVLHGLPLYAEAQLAGPCVLASAVGCGFIYPPTALVLALPLALVDDVTGFLLYEVACLAGLVLVLGSMARREGLGYRGTALLVLVYLVSPPTIEGAATGNVNLPIAVLVGLMWLYPRFSGYAAVVGALVKVFPIVGLAFAWRHRAPILAPLAFGFAVLLASTVLLGPGTWAEFITVMRNTQGGHEDGLLAPRQLLAPLIGDAAALLASLAATAALLVAAIRVRSDRLALFLVAMAMILPAPDWYTHYLLIPMVALAPYVASRAAAWPGVWARMGDATRTGSPAESTGRG